MSDRALTVTELTRRIRECLETQIDRVWVTGEISSWKIHGTSGHAYFCLKDERAIVNCVAWAPTVRAAARALRPRDGLRVRAFGRITVYEPRGSYQLIVEQMLDLGEGDLQAAFLRLKRKLEAEGLFDAERKRPLPSCPSAIGIVTSAGGAALRDMLRILEKRWPLAEVVLRPAPVQGAGAAEELAQALADLNRRGGVDVILIGRGGGSIEDLWAFNEEVLARAVRASAIPVVSAVGHEIDFSICDFVADVRAATPTHAAELATPDSAEVLRHLERDGRILRSTLARAMEGSRLRLRRLRTSRGLSRPEDLLRAGRLDLDRLADRLRESLRARARAGDVRLRRLERQFLRMDPGARLVASRRRLAESRRRLDGAAFARLERASGRIALAAARLEALGPEQVLARGYGIVFRGEDGRILRNAGDVAPGDLLRVRLHKGALACTVDEADSPDATRESAKTEGGRG